MNKLLTIALTLFAIVPVFAEDMKCEVKAQEEEIIAKEDINTPVPKGMDGAIIIVRQKDGKEIIMKIEEYKVVKRQQQFKVTKTKQKEIKSCVAEGKKNMLMLGVQKKVVDHDVSISQDANGVSATVNQIKSPVVDLSYMRRKAIGDTGVGVGVDTKGTVRGFIGTEF